MPDETTDAHSLIADLILLRGEVDKLNEGGAERARLEQLILNIEAEIELTQLGKASENLAEEVEFLIGEFETNHPTATAVLNNIMLTLSGMGV